MSKENVEKGMLDEARMITYAFIVGTMGFLKDNSIQIKEWLNYLGNTLEDSWSNLAGKGADEVMDYLLATAVLPLGAEVVSKKGNSTRAEVTVTVLPSEKVTEKFSSFSRNILSDFGVTRREFSLIYMIFEPIARAIGFNFTHDLEDDKEVLILEKIPPVKVKRGRPRTRV